MKKQSSVIILVGLGHFYTLQATKLSKVKECSSLADSSCPWVEIYFIFRLNIACDNVEHGCSAVVKLDMLSIHLEACEFNPKRPIPCEQGCGLVIPKDEIKVPKYFFF